MQINEFTRLFAELFDETDASVFTPETHFKQLDEWSSLQALAVIATVDEECEVTLKGDDIKQAETIADLFAAVEAKA